MPRRTRLRIATEAARLLLLFRSRTPLHIEHAADGWKVTIHVEEHPIAAVLVDPHEIPTPCEAAILQLLGDGQRRLRPAIVEALESQFSESNVCKTLARLVKAGRLTRVNRRGYAIAEVRAK